MCCTFADTEVGEALHHLIVLGHHAFAQILLYEIFIQRMYGYGCIYMRVTMISGIDRM